MKRCPICGSILREGRPISLESDVCENCGYADRGHVDDNIEAVDFHVNKYYFYNISNDELERISQNFKEGKIKSLNDIAPRTQLKCFNCGRGETDTYKVLYVIYRNEWRFRDQLQTPSKTELERAYIESYNITIAPYIGGTGVALPPDIENKKFRSKFIMQLAAPGTTGEQVIFICNRCEKILYLPGWKKVNWDELIKKH